MEGNIPIIRLTDDQWFKLTGLWNDRLRKSDTYIKDILLYPALFQLGLTVENKLACGVNIGLNKNLEYGSIGDPVISCGVKDLKSGFEFMFVFNLKMEKLGIYPHPTNEKGAKAICHSILSVLFAVEYSMANPEEIFDINPVTKKHRIKPCKSNEKGGNDEELYISILKAYQSHRGTAKTTGTGTPHSHEYGVRGFWRHLKSGRKIWVKPHHRCIGRGAENKHEYLVTKGANYA